VDKASGRYTCDSTPSPYNLFVDYQAVRPIVISKDEEGSRSIFLSDLHMPFADWPALKLAEAFMQDWDPKYIFYDGDIMDFYGISRFDKNPSRRFRLNDERRWAMEMLDRHHDMCSGAQQIWLDGNHEERIVKYLWERAPELADLQDEETGELLLGIPSLLGLNKRNVQYTSYAGHVNYLGFLVTHGNLLSKHSSYTAKQMSERHRSSGISGHSHRLGMYNWTGIKGPQAWYENGCLCRMDPDYMHNPNWQQGFHIGTVVNQKVHVLPGIIFDGSLYIEGKVYR
jgi:predicted phosphodiesterase